MILTEIAAGNTMTLKGWLCSTPAKVITLPQPVDDVDFCTCLFVCDYVENAYVLSTDEDNTYKNDYRRFLVNLRDATSTYVFTLIDSSGVETPLIDNTYGELFDKGFNTVQPLLASYRVDWFKVFDNLGYDTYTVKISQTDFGTTVEKESHLFKVTEFSELQSNKSVKIETIQTGVILNGQDFGGMQYRNMVRVEGSFEPADPKYEINRLQDSSQKDIDIQTRKFDSYSLVAEALPIAISKKLRDIDVMTDSILISNYDVMAEEQYRRIEVVSTGDVERGTKGVMNNRVTYTLGFKDRKSLLKRNFV